MNTTETQPASLPPAPRRLRRRKPVAFIPAALVGLFASFFVAAGVIGLATAVLKTAVAFAGTTITGRVLSTGVDSDADGSEYVAHVAYAYAGREIDKTITLSGAEYRSLSRGQAVPIRVLPLLPDQQPQLALTPGALPRDFGFMWLWAILWDGGLLAVYMAFRTRRRIYAEGVPAAGVVTRKFTEDNDGSAEYKVEFAFTPEGRLSYETHTGKMTVSRESWDGVAAGAPVTVLYLPNSPRYSVAYELGDYEAVG